MSSTRDLVSSSLGSESTVRYSTDSIFICKLAAVSNFHSNSNSKTLISHGLTITFEGLFTGAIVEHLGIES